MTDLLTATLSQAVGDWWQTAFSTEFIQGTVVTHLRDSCDKAHSDHYAKPPEVIWQQL